MQTKPIGYDVTNSIRSKIYGMFFGNDRNRSYGDAIRINEEEGLNGRNEEET